MIKPSKINRIGLALLSCILVIIGTSGFLAPSTNITSTATAYNVFHIICGLIGFGTLMYSCDRYVKTLNLAFGIVNLYLFFAGQLYFFPKQVFSLKPADDWFHLISGITFITIAYLGMDKEPAPSSHPTTHSL